MASSTLQVATVTSTRTFAKTNAEVATILEWFIANTAGEMPEGLTPAQQNQWKLDQAHDEMLRYVVRTARQNRLRMLQAESTIEQQATQETEL